MKAELPERSTTDMDVDMDVRWYGRSDADGPVVRTSLSAAGSEWRLLDGDFGTALLRWSGRSVIRRTVLHWLVRYFQLWPQYAIYVIPIVSAYLVIYLCPSCLEDVYDAMKQENTE